MVAPANLRDLGGLRTADGRRVRSGVLLRSEFPHWLIDGPPPDPPPRTALDLRRAHEIEIEDIDWIGRFGTQVCRVSLGSGTVAFVDAHSDSYLASGDESLAIALAAVVAPGALPVHFFCAAGKDRTGLLAIMVLELLGVVREDIAADFAATGQGIAAVLDRLGEHRYYRELFGERPLEVFIPDPAALEAVFAWLDSRGGVQAWASAVGIAPEWIQEFRSTVLADPSA